MTFEGLPYPLVLKIFHCKITFQDPHTQFICILQVFLLEHDVQEDEKGLFPDQNTQSFQILSL